MEHRVVAAGLLSLGTAVGGFVNLWDYENRPGESGQPPRTWAAPFERAVSGPTLVMALHPRCVCSRASVAELSELLARPSRRPAIHFLLLQPVGDPAWAKGDLRDAAAALPGARVWPDPDGKLARGFGLQTSGHVLVYDERGRLAFSGGITAARGHQGDNVGADAVASILDGRAPARASTPVFGCMIVGSERRVEHGRHGT